MQNRVLRLTFLNHFFTKVNTCMSAIYALVLDLLYFHVARETPIMLKYIYLQFSKLLNQLIIQNNMNDDV